MAWFIRNYKLKLCVVSSLGLCHVVLPDMSYFRIIFIIFMVAVFTYVYYTLQPKDLHPQRVMKIDLITSLITWRKKLNNKKKSCNLRKLAPVDLNVSILYWSSGQERDSTSARVLRTQPAGLPISSGNGDGWNRKWYKMYTRYKEDCLVIHPRFRRGVRAPSHSKTYLDAPLGKIILQKTSHPG